MTVFIGLPPFSRYLPSFSRFFFINFLDERVQIPSLARRFVNRNLPKFPSMVTRKEGGAKILFPFFPQTGICSPQ
jgi:hypothetical protein